MGTSKKCQCGKYINRGLTVDIVIIRKNEVLLIKRGREPQVGYWALPGGFVDWDETVIAACRREAKEEVGLAIGNPRLIGVYDNPARFEQRICLAYLVTASGKARAGDDATAVNWFSLGDLPKKLAFDHEQIIKDALALI
jgi:8-oxo-dGTP diphosphatase